MIPLFKPFVPSDLPELQNIMNSGLLNYSKWGKLFEKELSEFIGNPYLVTLNSYNSAVLVAISTLGLKNGDEIIASPMSCLASNQPFAIMGIKIIWADIDPKTGTLDPDDVRKKISINTKAILHNHFCGYPGYINEINNIGKEKSIYVIDDAIEAFGSEYYDKKIGNVNSDVTLYSFQTVRLPNTIDGGAIAFKNLDHYEKALLVRDYGIDRKAFRRNDGEINPSCDIKIPGYGALLNEINSYMGCEQMKNINHLLEKQRQNSLYWESYFSENNIYSTQAMQVIKEAKPNYWIYGILVNNKHEALKFFREKSFYASSVHLNNNNYSVFDNSIKLTGVDEFSNQFLALPCGWWMN
jgi:perosamine synthetase